MIVCKNCGHQNEDGADFCGNCGKFLEWTGERVVAAQPEPEPEPPPPAPAPQPTHVGLIDRVKHAVGMEEAPAAGAAPPTADPNGPPPPAAAPPAPPAPAYRPIPVTSSAPAPAQAPLPPIPAQPTSPAPPPAPATPYAFRPAAPTAPAPVPYTPYAASPPRANAPAPVSAPEPVLAGVGAPSAAVSPQSVQPVAEPQSQKPSYVAPPRTTRQPARFQPPTRKAGPDDVYCGNCGEVNDKSRHFCRRCGNSLDEAIAVKLPWYRRLFNRVFGVRTREAGWRPHRVGAPNVFGFIWRIVRLAVVAIVILAVAAFFLIPSFHTFVVDRFNEGRRIVLPKIDPVYPTGVSASSSIAGHLPTLADDRLKGTYWAALPTDHTPTLTFRFDTPQDLADIGFTSGASGTAPADQFLAQPRPHAVHLVFSNGTSKDLNLADKDTAQFFPIDAKGVTSVEVFIVTTYPTAGAAPSSVAIDEVEFRIKD